MSAYRRNFDKTKCMYFLLKDEKLLEKYNEVWKKVSNIIKNEFDRKLVCDEKYLKTKIKSTQMFLIIKYQKKALNVFVYR